MSTAANTLNNSTQETEDSQVGQDHLPMKFSVPHERLLSRLLLAGRAVSTRTAMPSLGGILVTATAGSIELRATDMEIGLSLALDAEIETEGSALLPGRLLVDVVRSLPSGEQVSVELRPEQRDVEINRRHRALSPAHAARRGLPAPAGARRRDDDDARGGLRRHRRARRPSRVT